MNVASYMLAVAKAQQQPSVLVVDPVANYLAESDDCHVLLKFSCVHSQCHLQICMVHSPCGLGFGMPGSEVSM